MLKILNIVLEKKSCLSDDFSAKIDKTRNNWSHFHHDIDFKNYTNKFQK